MTEVEINEIEQANFKAWLERQEERWEKPLPKRQIERPVFDETEIAF